MDNISIKRTNSGDQDFRTLVLELDTELRATYGLLMDVYDGHNVIEIIDTVVIAYVDGVPAGCGCFKPFDANTVEIKRMYVRPGARGKGVSALILRELELWAAAVGFANTVLETGFKQVAALGLYQKAGYVRIPNYGPYAELPDSLCFNKKLALSYL